MKVVEPPPLSDTTCSSSPRPATVSKYQRIKMDFSVPFVLYFCTFYILYFLHLVWHNLHFFAETVSRQSISTDQKFIPVGKSFCKEQTTAETKQSEGKIFVTFGCREKWETRKSQYINRSKIYSHWKKFLQRTMAKPKQSDGKNFVTFGCREKWETRNIFPTKQRTKNS